MRSFFFIVGADAHISPHDVCYTVRCGHRTLHNFQFSIINFQFKNAMRSFFFFNVRICIDKYLK